MTVCVVTLSERPSGVPRGRPAVSHTVYIRSCQSRNRAIQAGSGILRSKRKKAPPARLAREREPGARGGSNIEKHFGYRSNLTTDQIPCDKCKFTLGAATPPDEHRGCPSRQPRSIAAARAGLAAHGWRVRRRACGCKEVAGGVGWWKGSDGEKGTGGAWAAAWAAALSGRWRRRWRRVRRRPVMGRDGLG